RRAGLGVRRRALSLSRARFVVRDLRRAWTISISESRRAEAWIRAKKEARHRAAHPDLPSRDARLGSEPPERRKRVADRGRCRKAGRLSQHRLEVGGLEEASER